MKYYIQGSPARAKEIEAAFERLGIRADGYDFSRKDVLFFTFEAKGKTYMMSSCLGTGLDNIIKTHPDYKELELPVEPKFKVGDWIVQNDNGTVSQITKTINGKDEYGEYHAYEHTNGYFAACFENEYHLWTIRDAKDGDVLVYEYTDTIGIFEETNEIYWHSKIYCAESTYTKVYHHGGSHHIKLTKPATKEQRDLFFAKIKEEGYEWDEKKKELRKIQSHYDIANFKAGMPVLERSGNDEHWDYNIFSRYLTNNCSHPFILVGCHSRQCIPFNEETKHLLGTTDMPSEEYINW